MIVKNKIIFVSLLLVSNLQAQVISIWKNDSATNFNIFTQLDSITFKSDSLKMWGLSSNLSYNISSNLDSITFQKGIYYGSIIDERDGQVYKTVEIGNQTWMAQNLNFGEYLADNFTDSLQQNMNQKFCYDNNELSCDSLGGLYQWHTAMNLSPKCNDGILTCRDSITTQEHKGICPASWHIPTKSEWEELSLLLGEKVGVKMKKKKLKDLTNPGFLQ